MSPRSDPDPAPRLTPELLVSAYAQGYFPMAERRDGKVQFYSADPRGVMPLDGRFHVRTSLAKALRKINASTRPFTLRLDSDFAAVVAGCAEARPAREETWISPEIEAAYLGLHRLGLAHSIECWQADSDGAPRLVGGLYGVALGGAFFGESMFSRTPFASQHCLVETVAWLRAGGFTLFDTQAWNPHLGQFGCEEIPAAEYLARLRASLAK